MDRVSFAPQSLQVAGFGCIRNGRVVLRQLDVALQSGQVLLLRGSNGTGKSTLLRNLAGLMPWRAGSLQWAGKTCSPRDPCYQQQLAYLGHQCGMNDALSVRENLCFALALQAVACTPERMQPVLQQLEVLPLLDRPFGRLSQGQRRRVALARVVLSNRPLWLLDEPDNALDVQGSSLLSTLLIDHAKAGGLSVVVSHRGMTVPGVPCHVLDLDEHRAAPIASSAPAAKDDACTVV